MLNGRIRTGIVARIVDTTPADEYSRATILSAVPRQGPSTATRIKAIIARRSHAAAIIAGQRPQIVTQAM